MGNVYGDVRLTPYSKPSTASSDRMLLATSSLPVCPSTIAFRGMKTSGKEFGESRHAIKIKEGFRKVLEKTTIILIELCVRACVHRLYAAEEPENEMKQNENYNDSFLRNCTRV